jgi:hypothetical protein
MLKIIVVNNEINKEFMSYMHAIINEKISARES